MYNWMGTVNSATLKKSAIRSSSRMDSPRSGKSASLFRASIADGAAKTMRTSNQSQAPGLARYNPKPRPIAAIRAMNVLMRQKGNGLRLLG